VHRPLRAHHPQRQAHARGDDPHLLSNAVRYTDRGRILLGCRRNRRQCSHRSLGQWRSVSPKTNFPHIFHEYYQEDRRCGAGRLRVGSCDRKRLGEILDHRVEVRSIPGKGHTVFHCGSPRSIRCQDTGSKPAGHPHHEAFLGSVLAIEDEASVRTALGRLLKKRGV